MSLKGSQKGDHLESLYIVPLSLEGIAGGSSGNCAALIGHTAEFEICPTGDHEGQLHVGPEVVALGGKGKNKASYADGCLFNDEGHGVFNFSIEGGHA